MAGFVITGFTTGHVLVAELGWLKPCELAQMAMYRTEASLGTDKYVSAGLLVTSKYPPTVCSSERTMRFRSACE